jgi:hypothetical protein
MSSTPLDRGSFAIASALTVAAVALALSACSGAPQATPALDGANVLAAARSVKAIPKATSLPSQLLFVPDGAGSVAIYPLGDPGSGPVGLITGLPGLQYQTAVDTKGNLYVTNASGGFFNAANFFVAKYAPPYTSAPVKLSTVWKGATFWATGVVVDAKGTTYVSPCGEYCGTDASLRGVLVYPPGSTKPKQLITDPRLETGNGLALDTKGNLYGVSYNTSTNRGDVYEIPAGTTTIEMLNLHGVLGGGDVAPSIAVDPKGNLYVGDPTQFPTVILEYRPGAHEPFRQIDDGVWLSTFEFPRGLIYGADGNLYASIGCGAGAQQTQQCPQIDAFKPNAGKPFETVGVEQHSNYAPSVATYPNAILQASAVKGKQP